MYHNHIHTPHNRTRYDKDASRSAPTESDPARAHRDAGLRRVAGGDIRRGRAAGQRARASLLSASRIK